MLCRGWLPLVLVLFIAARAGAEDAPATPADLAAAVSAAHKAGDAKKVAHLRERSPFPWFVLYELLLADDVDGAAAFAKASDDATSKALAAYVAKRRETNEPEAWVKLYAALEGIQSKGGPPAVIAATDPVRPPFDSIAALGVVDRRAQALLSVGRFRDIPDLLSHAITAAEALGWPRRSAIFHRVLGVAHYRLGARPEALEAWRAAAKIAREHDIPREEMLASLNVGVGAKNLGLVDEALAAQERCAELARQLGDKVQEANVLNNVGTLHLAQGRPAEALTAFQASEKLKASQPNRGSHAMTIGNIGTALARLDRHAEAMEHATRARTMCVEVGDRPGEARALGLIARIHHQRYAYDEAFKAYEKTLAIFEGARWLPGILEVKGNLASLHMELGELDAAADALATTVRIAKQLRNPFQELSALHLLASLEEERGRYAVALEHLDGARTLATTLKNPASVAASWQAEAVIRTKLGQYAEALRSAEKAAAAEQVAGVTDNGPEHAVLKARVYRMQEDYAAAREVALAELASARDPIDRTALLFEVIAASRELEDQPPADKAIQEVAEIAEAIDSNDLRARVQFTRGTWLLEAGRGEGAAAAFTQALETTTDPRLEARILAGQARVQMLAGNHGRALAKAREALDLAADFGEGLDVDEAAGTRETFATVADMAVLAAAATDDPEAVFGTIESVRSINLLRSLRARESLREAVVPQALGRRVAAAEHAMAEATTKERRAQRGRRLRTMRAARKQLDEARAARADAIKVMRREARKAATLVHPEPTSLADLTKTLGPHQAYVAIVRTETRTVALVVRPAGARIVELGSSADITKQALAVLGDDEAPIRPGALEPLRRSLILPLGLGKDVTHVTLSPGGQLGYVPFSLLLPGRSIAYVPSGSVLLELERGTPRAGAGVLALGDPVYRNTKLPALPASGEEAKAVGTKHLLGPDASAAKLREALAGSEAFRAVHLACHGLVDADQPLQSSLALSDGQLTALDVFQMTIDAELVVLSACETGKGRVYASEGIVGLTRAFMFAGAPRVMCSLWKVDDEATAALMKKFYTLWNPPKGEGLPAAEALAKAQAHVRAREGWEHPKYWAAWVIWGRP